MKSATGRRIGCKFCRARGLACYFEVGANTIAVVIRVDEVVPSVIRGINVDSFDPSAVALLQQFQDF